jgi:hypothetical protein
MSENTLFSHDSSTDILIKKRNISDVYASDTEDSHSYADDFELSDFEDEAKDDSNKVNSSVVKKTPYTIKEKLDYIDEFKLRKNQDPTLSEASFCRENGIIPATFRSWLCLHLKIIESKEKKRKEIKKPETIRIFTQKEKDQIIEHFFTANLSFRKYAEKYGYKEGTIKPLISGSKINPETGLKKADEYKIRKKAKRSQELQELRELKEMKKSYTKKSKKEVKNFKK